MKLAMSSFQKYSIFYFIMWNIFVIFQLRLSASHQMSIENGLWVQPSIQMLMKEDAFCPMQSIQTMTQTTKGVTMQVIKKASWRMRCSGSNQVICTMYGY